MPSRPGQAHGYRVAAVDLRGHGGAAAAPGALDYRNFEPGDWRDALLDLEAARVLLMSRRGPDNPSSPRRPRSLLALQFVRDTPSSGHRHALAPARRVRIDAALIAQRRPPALLLWTRATPTPPPLALRDRAVYSSKPPTPEQREPTFVAAPRRLPGVRLAEQMRRLLSRQTAAQS